MNIKKICLLILAAAVMLPHFSYAAPINNVRSSINPARVRLVLDSSAHIDYKVKKDGKTLEIELPKSSSKAQRPVVKDQFIKNIKLVPEGKNKSRLEIELTKDCQYKVYNLENPHRLVVDIFRIDIVKQTEKIADGVTYTYLQDEINGKQIQSYLLSVDKKADYELRPFSAAGTYNGRGYISKAAKALDLIGAVNASYFDSDGWVIGNVKDNGNIFGVDFTPRSALISDGKNNMIVKDLVYSGVITLPSGKVLQAKGMNRARIAEDLVIFNEYYGRSTKTNEYGREVKIKNGRVIAVATAGNMSIEPGTMVISGHGSNAAALSGIKVGDRITVQESLGNAAADKAKTVIGGGPLLLEDGKVCVRSGEEHIAGDIARGRSPRTAVGLKKDGTMLVLVVDGRNGNSAGVTLQEMALYLLRLGARDAVNFDGGGSSVMVVDGKIKNVPSDGSERRVSIGAGLFPKN